MDETVNIAQRADPSAGVVELTRTLVSIPSVNPAMEATGTGEADIADVTAGWLAEWGFDVSRVEAAPGRTSVLARLERGPGRTLLLSGHLDTVGVAGMRVQPFEAALREGRLWGRGSADMKAGVAAALAAARDAAGSDFRGTLLVALTADEEEAAIGCRRLVADGLTADGAIVCEPTGLAVMPAHKGFAWLEIVFRGQAAHGSRPERGVDAIRHAGLFLARLDALDQTLSRREVHPLLGSGSIHAGTIRGGSAPSVYPAECRLTLERRTLPGESMSAVRSEVEYLLAELRSDVPKLDADVTALLERPGTEVKQSHPLVQAVLEAAASVGIQPKVKGMTAWVEAGVFNEAGIPALCFGPGSILEAHSADESVPLDEIERAHAALTALVREFLA